MLLLPYENFYIITKLKPEEVQSRLEQEVSPGNNSFFKNPFGSSSISTYFEGFAVNGHFEFKRSINYRNSFLPEIKGSTEACLNGSRVHIKMSMFIFVTIFICIWLSIAAFAGLAMVIQEINKGNFSAVVFAPFLMFLFGYLLTIGSFKYESRKAKAKLLEMLDGEVERTDC
jgi:hypothetical protein